MKHTKGPWKPAYEETQEIQAVQASDGNLICWMHDGCDNFREDSENDANARLIAVAPKMYRLLERMKEVEETIGDMIQAHREYRKCAYRADDLIRELQSAGLKTEASE